MLYDEIRHNLKVYLFPDQEIYTAFKERLEEGSLVRDENQATHFCVYFLPYNAKDKKIFIGHHKKSGLWLSPGGHIDAGESILMALNREITEELGVKNFFKETPAPFLFFLTKIISDTRPCKAHFDMWYLVPTGGSDFKVDVREFHATRWVTLDEADKIITDPANRKALGIMRTH